MAQYITKAEGGNMRITHRCPCCGSRAKVEAKKTMTNKLFTQQVMCLNPKCGWVGIATTEYTHTVSPPSPVYEDGDVPRQLSKAEILQDESQQPLL